MADLPTTANFRSFWMGGFEAASHLNRFHDRIDMIAGTRHDTMALTDYQLLRSLGLGGARDALRWHLIDRGTGAFDFSSFLPQLEAACTTGTQVIWSLCHYGYPDDLDIFSAAFIRRFVDFALATARLIRDHTDEAPYFTPFNEISFFVWAASRPGFFPFAEGRDTELKRQIIRASIEVIGALRAFDPRCRFVFPEPIIRVVPPLDRPDLSSDAKRDQNSQFEALDMIAGRQAPELGGHADLLDIIGMNFYHESQWEIGTGRLGLGKGASRPALDAGERDDGRSLAALSPPRCSSRKPATLAWAGLPGSWRSQRKWQSPGPAAYRLKEFACFRSSTGTNGTTRTIGTTADFGTSM